jgi:hypothetical protein
MKMHGKVDVWFHIFLTSALVGGDFRFMNWALLPLGKEGPIPSG